MKTDQNSEQQAVVQLEIGIDKIESLFNQGDLCASDIRCLNCESKKCIWNLCLSLCAKKMTCSIACSEHYVYCEQTAQKMYQDSSVLVCVKKEIKNKLV